MPPKPAQPPQASLFLPPLWLCLPSLPTRMSTASMAPRVSKSSILWTRSKSGSSHTPDTSYHSITIPWWLLTTRSSLLQWRGPQKCLRSPNLSLGRTNRWLLRSTIQRARNSGLTPPWPTLPTRTSSRRPSRWRLDPYSSVSSLNPLNSLSLALRRTRKFGSKT